MSELRAVGEKALRQGRNIAQALRSHLNADHNTPEAIEVTYDLQAGTYVRFAEENPEYVRTYAAQLAALLEPHLQPDDVLLDAGAGELTNLSHMVAAIRTPLSRILAFDISERRLAVGREYAARHMGPAVDRLEVFQSELGAIPLPANSVDVVTTNHALEPNGGRERELLVELLRVARRKLVLFEPCFEIASAEARARMTEHGYVRGLADQAQALGAKVEMCEPLGIVDNPLNPTACIVISAEIAP